MPNKINKILAFHITVDTGTDVFERGVDVEVAQIPQVKDIMPILQKAMVNVVDDTKLRFTVNDVTYLS